MGDLCMRQNNFGFVNAGMEDGQSVWGEQALLRHIYSLEDVATGCAIDMITSLHAINVSTVSYTID